MYTRYRMIACMMVALALVAGCDGAGPTATPAPPTAPPQPVPTGTPAPTPTAKPVSSATPPAADGSEGVLAFTSDRDGDYDVYVMNVPGGTDPGSGDPRQLTDGPGTEGYAALSPNGTKVAFYAYDDMTTWSIYVMDADGISQGPGDWQRLTDREGFRDSAPDWSPDGTQIAFASEHEGSFEIWTMNADGSAQRKIEGISGGGPQWSPDGTQILFHSEGQGPSEIYVAAVDGTNPQQLTDNDAQDWWPVWSPDGSQIAFMSDRDGNWEIYAMNADGTNQRRLTDDDAEDRKPDWSPDGTQLVFVSDRDGDMEIFVMDADGTNQRQLTRNSTREIQPAWWPPVAPPLSLKKSSQTFARAETFQVSLGDLDGDGDLDAVFANAAFDSSQVWLNDGTGKFVDSGQELTPQGHGVGMGDLDGDGDLDLFITCAHYGAVDAYTKKPSRVYLNNGQGVFQDTGQDLGDTELSGNDVNLIDVDGDGDLDAHVVYYEVGGAPDKIYLNDGQARFADSGIAIPENVVWGDLDSDGDVDIFSKDLEQGYRVLLNDGTGGFASSWDMADSQAIDGGLALGDLDGDGDLDVLVAKGVRSGGSYPTTLLLNDGTGRFSDSGQSLNPTVSADLAIGDIDQDGDLDVFVSNAFSSNEVWLNDGTGHLIDSGLRLKSSGGGVTLKASLGDLDGDGDLDVFVGCFSGRAELWFSGSGG